MDPAESRAFLVSVTGSSHSTFDDFDIASNVGHDAINEFNNIIVTLLPDGSLAENTRVMIGKEGCRRIRADTIAYSALTVLGMKVSCLPLLRLV